MRIHVLTLALLFVPAAALAQAPTDGQPTYEQLIQHAHQAAEASQFVEAVHDLEAAYGLRQDPQLLLELARGHRRLGHARETADYYLRYRLASGQLTPALAEEVNSGISAATAPAVAAAVNYGVLAASAPMKTITRPNQAMLIGGATLFGTAYTAAAITGGAFTSYGGDVSHYDYNSGNSTNTSYGNSKTAGGLLFIPFIGPFVSAIADRDPAWVGPWVAVDGGMQLLGLALMIASRYNPQTARVLAKMPQISPYASGSGAGANVALRF